MKQSASYEDNDPFEYAKVHPGEFVTGITVGQGVLAEYADENWSHNSLQALATNVAAHHELVRDDDSVPVSTDERMAVILGARAAVDEAFQTQESA